jgi:hypothetical protein
VTLDDVVREFRRHLWMPDLGLFYVTLGTVVANRLPGKPVWTLLVGEASSGKSEMLSSLRHLREYRDVTTYTEASLLSGSARNPRGILAGLEFGLLVYSDLTPMLSKHRGDHDGVIGILRNVYDGEVSRHLGTVGGTLCWEGKVGLLAGVTGMIDDHDLGGSGERFLRYRLPTPSDDDLDELTAIALEDVHAQPDHQARRVEEVTRLLDGLRLPDSPPGLSADENARLSTLAILASRCRSTVVRDAHKGDLIERVPDPEGPTRMVSQLAQLVAGMRVLGVPRDEVWRLVAKVALDGMHPLRRRVLQELVDSRKPHATAVIAARCALPQTSVRRHLQDLTAHGVLTMTYDSPETWAVSDWTSQQWWAAASWEQR